MSYGAGATQILRAVLQQMNNDGFDFSQLTTNANGVIKALNFMFTGQSKGMGPGNVVSPRLDRFQCRRCSNREVCMRQRQFTLGSIYSSP